MLRGNLPMSSSNVEGPTGRITLNSRLKGNFYAGGCKQRAKWPVFWRCVDFSRLLIMECSFRSRYQGWTFVHTPNEQRAHVLRAPAVIECLGEGGTLSLEGRGAAGGGRGWG